MSSTESNRLRGSCCTDHQVLYPAALFVLFSHAVLSSAIKVTPCHISLVAIATLTSCSDTNGMYAPLLFFSSLLSVTGCGKTLLARVVAAQCGAKLFVINGPEIIDSTLGASEQKVTQRHKKRREEKISKERREGSIDGKAIRGASKTECET